MKAIETFRRLWRLWSSREPQTVGQVLSLIHKDVKGFGSAASEKFTHSDAIRSQLEAEMRQIPQGFSYEIKWMDTTMLSEDLVGLLAEIRVEVSLPKKKIVLEPVRASHVLKLFGDDMLILQWHISVPDAGTEDEIFPGAGKPRLYDEASVLFTDFAGFTQIVSSISADRLVDELNEIFARFDEITFDNRLYKVKTIGDAYMAVGGIKIRQHDHAVKCVKAAREMIAFLEDRNSRSDVQWHMRAGVHTGPVVAGLIGRENLQFDIWGDTVNFASRMENTGMPDKINVSTATYHLIREVFPCSYRGKIEVKGKGKADMYFVD